MRWSPQEAGAGRRSVNVSKSGRPVRSTTPRLAHARAGKIRNMSGRWSGERAGWHWSPRMPPGNPSHPSFLWDQAGLCCREDNRCVSASWSRSGASSQNRQAFRRFVEAAESKGTRVTGHIGILGSLDASVLSPDSGARRLDCRVDRKNSTTVTQFPHTNALDTSMRGNILPRCRRRAEIPSSGRPSISCSLANARIGHESLPCI